MKFKEITQDRDNIVTLLKNKPFENECVRVYENEDTTIIYSSTGDKKHASLSNPYRLIEESEITYAAEKIMKLKMSEVKVYLTPNGIIHIHKNMLH